MYKIVLNGGNLHEEICSNYGRGRGTVFTLSRQASPKQILNLSGNDVMINETINRKFFDSL